MKIALNYDPNTGNVTDDSGMLIICYLGLSHCEIKEEKTKGGVEGLVKLKGAGFTADEIMAMDARGVI